MSAGKGNQNWVTPPDFFGWLDGMFDFDIDVCATAESAKCPYFIDEGMDALRETGWVGWKINVRYVDIDGAEPYSDPFEVTHCIRSAYCNHPWANPMPWTKKCHEQGIKYADSVVVQIVVSSMAQWHNYAVANADQIWRLSAPRIAYIDPETGEPVKGNQRDSMVIIWRRKPVGIPAREVTVDWRKEVENGDSD